MAKLPSHDQSVLTKTVDQAVCDVLESLYQRYTRDFAPRDVVELESSEPYTAPGRDCLHASKNEQYLPLESDHAMMQEALHDAFDSDSATFNAGSNTALPAQYFSGAINTSQPLPQSFDGWPGHIAESEVGGPSVAIEQAFTGAQT
jgi:hypothetical protein